MGASHFCLYISVKLETTTLSKDGATRDYSLGRPQVGHLEDDLIYFAGVMLIHLAISVAKMKM